MTIILGVSMFTAVVLALVAVILVAKSKLVASGDVNIVVNDQKTLTVPAGGKLLGCLSDAGIFVSSACGGGQFGEPIVIGREVVEFSGCCRVNKDTGGDLAGVDGRVGDGEPDLVVSSRQPRALASPQQWSTVDGGQRNGGQRRLARGLGRVEFGCRGQVLDSAENVASPSRIHPVSYTHLTLPTKA